MPRKCTVELDVQRISAPGVWLPSGEDVYLSISLFGQEQETRPVRAEFPLIIQERFRFEKTFYGAVISEDVSSYLEGELIVIELLQRGDLYSCDVRLASFTTTARDFLYPYPSRYPSYVSEYREMLLPRTYAFPDVISPKMAFTTKAVITEDYLESALESLEISRRSRSRTRSPARSFTRARSLSLGSIPRVTSPVYSSYTAAELEALTSTSYVSPLRRRSVSPYRYRTDYSPVTVRRSRSPAPLSTRLALERSRSPFRTYPHSILRKSLDDLAVDDLLRYRRYNSPSYYSWRAGYL